MPEAITISTEKPAIAAFDYGELRKLAIEHIEKTGSAIWTDYNIHDPGITTLEILCYALTDLSYRTAYSIPDLLATENDTAKNIQEHFFSAATILPNNATTINDYRKLLIDIVGVKNAWIKKAAIPVFADVQLKKLSYSNPAGIHVQKVQVKGSYNVLLEFDTNVEDKDAIKINANEVLMANRNLSENFIGVDEVAQDYFKLCGEIEIAATADPFETLADIFFNIQVYLTPLVKFYWLKELFDQNYTSDKIFEGPLLQHGFIKEDELLASELRSEVYLSDIMQKILQVPGVINILDVVFNGINHVGEMPDKWIVKIKDGAQPIINILKSNIIFYKSGMPFRPDLGIIETKFKQRMQNYITGNDQVITEDIVYDTGNFKNAGKYFSVQNHFPKNYGISHWGLPPDATFERIMQAKQLRGYLYFFDQQLANFLSQLAHVKNLFSFDDEKQTYFTKLVNNFKGFDDDVLAANDAADVFVNAATVNNEIQAAAEDLTNFYNRRNLFVDHLLSRFAETFFDYVNVLKTVFPGTGHKEIIDTKLNFLKQYPQYSSQRFVGYNYTTVDALWNTINISGLEKRLQRLLGFENIERRTLVHYYFIINEALNASSVKEYWFEIIDNHSGNIMIAGVEKFLEKTDAIDELEIALLLVKNDINFLIAENSSKFYIELKDKANKVIGSNVNEFNTQEDAENGLGKLILFFDKFSTSEGMYLVEHLLLLPPENIITEEETGINNHAFMPICVDQNCNDCSETDPYSFRVSIVLPAYASRFLNIDFRNYCERIIRMEAPAHLFVKICWVSNEQLQEFEKAYKLWLEVKAGISTDTKQETLRRFVKILTELKSIYPPARLQDCAGTEERNLFLLNKNALGTLKT